MPLIPRSRYSAFQVYLCHGRIHRVPSSATLRPSLSPQPWCSLGVHSGLLQGARADTLLLLVGDVRLENGRPAASDSSSMDCCDSCSVHEPVADRMLLASLRVRGEFFLSAMGLLRFTVCFVGGGCHSLCSSPLQMSKTGWELTRQEVHEECTLLIRAR